VLINVEHLPPRAKKLCDGIKDDSLVSDSLHKKLSSIIRKDLKIR
jgi:hypothetical protein